MLVLSVDWCCYLASTAFAEAMPWARTQVGSPISSSAPTPQLFSRNAAATAAAASSHDAASSRGLQARPWEAGVDSDEPRALSTAALTAAVTDRHPLEVLAPPGSPLHDGLASGRLVYERIERIKPAGASGRSAGSGQVSGRAKGVPVGRRRAGTVSAGGGSDAGFVIRRAGDWSEGAAGDAGDETAEGSVSLASDQGDEHGRDDPRLSRPAGSLAAGGAVPRRSGPGERDGGGDGVSAASRGGSDAAGRAARGPVGAAGAARSEREGASVAASEAAEAVGPLPRGLAALRRRLEAQAAVSGILETQLRQLQVGREPAAQYYTCSVCLCQSP